MKVCEENIVIEGEGKYCGTPTYYIRTTGCNLRCAWHNEDGSITNCDTPYTSHQPEQGYDFDIEKTLEVLSKTYLARVTITGGEPTIYPDLPQICNKFVGDGYRVTIETNGTKFYSNMKQVFISASPKLSSSYAVQSQTMLKIHQVNNRFTESLRRWIKTNDYQLKFVINKDTDIDEIKNIIQKVNGNNRKVWLMPQGTTSKQIREKSEWIMEICKEYNYNFSQRLHIMVYGNKRGV